MQSMCVECNKLYKPKDFAEARKRVCPDCRAKAQESVEHIRYAQCKLRSCSVERDKKAEAPMADGRMPEVKPVKSVEPVKSGMAPSKFIPKPDNKFNQRPLVWAK